MVKYVHLFLLLGVAVLALSAGGRGVFLRDAVHRDLSSVKSG